MKALLLVSLLLSSLTATARIGMRPLQVKADEAAEVMLKLSEKDRERLTGNDLEHVVVKGISVKADKAGKTYILSTDKCNANVGFLANHCFPFITMEIKTKSVETKSGPSIQILSTKILK